MLRRGFTPLESPIIYGRDDIDKNLIPYRKGGVKAFLTGFTFKKKQWLLQGIDISLNFG
jgi:hypothetical protein